MKLYGHFEVREINPNLMDAKKKLISYKEKLCGKNRTENLLNVLGLIRRPKILK